MRRRKIRGEIRLERTGTVGQGRTHNLLYLSIVQIYAGPEFHNAYNTRNEKVIKPP